MDALGIAVGEAQGSLGRLVIDRHRSQHKQSQTDVHSCERFH